MKAMKDTEERIEGRKRKIKEWMRKVSILLREMGVGMSCFAVWMVDLVRFMPSFEFSLSHFCFPLIHSFVGSFFL